ncbi:MAG: tetratricopeptide repeat protein [Flammeovirgaceae bacterium]|nr:tetratricopeptide repeat protein [Flammeovirgaceae bacterium]
MSILKKVTLYIFVLAICGVGEAIAQKNSKCTLDDLKGKWFGEWELNKSTSNFMMIVSVDKVDKCKISGTIYWPDYFNSKSKFEGKLENDTLYLRDYELTQGYDMKFGGVYKLPFSDSENLTGFWLNPAGQKDAKYSLKKQSALTKEELFAISDQIKAHVKTFGVTRVLEGKPDISFEELVKRHGDKNPPFNDSFVNLEFSGKVTINKMEMPVCSIFAYPDRFYMKMDMQNLSFLMAANGKNSWSYNPMEDELTVEEFDMEEFKEKSVYKKNHLKSLIDDGYKMLLFNEALVDEVDVYRIVFEKEDSRITKFVDKASFLVCRTDKNNELEYLYEIKDVDGFPIPSKMKQVTLEMVNHFEFDKMRFLNEIDENLFEIPEELKSKENNTFKQSEHFNELGIALFAKGNHDEAIIEYNKAININPGEPAYYNNRGAAKNGKDDFYSAISDFNIAIELNPNFAEAYNRRGLSKYYLNDYKNAIPDFTSCIEIDSTYENAYFNRGNTYYSLGNKESAYFDFKKLEKLNRKEPKYFYYKAIVAADLQKYDTAIISYNKAIELDLNHANIYNFRGVAYYSLDSMEFALNDFKIATSLDTLDAVKFENMADAYYYLDDFMASAKAYKKALSLDENNDGLYNKLGLTYLKQDIYDVAVSKFTKALEINNQNATYYDNRAYAKTQLMDFMGAVEDYSNSIDIYSQDPDIYYRRGLLKLSLKDNFDACRDFKKAKELGSEDAQAALDEHCFMNKNGG